MQYNTVIAKSKNIKKSKNLHKEWKKKKKNMTPMQLKELVEENHRLKTQLSTLAKAKKKQNVEANSIIRLRNDIDSLQKFSNLFDSLKKDGQIFFSDKLHLSKEQENIAQRFTNEIVSEKDPNYNKMQSVLSTMYNKAHANIDNENFLKGLAFKVQIGAYAKRNIEKTVQDNIHVDDQDRLIQSDEKGLHKYTIFIFRDYWKADKFKKEVRAMGIQDAWIVPVKDGKRIPLKEALHNIKKTKP